MDVNSDVARWFSAAELAGMALPGYPRSARRFHDRAVSEGWEIQTVPSQGRYGNRREYQPPPEVQALIDARRHATPAEIAGKPVPGVEKALEAFANPHEYRAREQAAHPYEAPDYALLESLIRFAEGRLTRNVTPMLLDRVDQVVEVWGPVATARPDLAARLARIKASVDLLRLA